MLLPHSMVRLRVVAERETGQCGEGWKYTRFSKDTHHHLPLLKTRDRNLSTAVDTRSSYLQEQNMKHMRLTSKLPNVTPSWKAVRDCEDRGVWYLYGRRNATNH